MSADTRLQRLGRAGSWGCAVTATALVLGSWAYVWSQPLFELVAPLGFPSLEHVAGWQAVCVRLLACAAMTLGGLALIPMAASFRSIASGRYFSSSTIDGITRFAGAVLLAAVASAVTPTLSSAVLSIGAAPGQSRLVLMLGSNHLLSLLASFAFYTVALLLREASTLQRENASFI